MWWGAQQASVSTNCCFGFYTQLCRLDTLRDWQTNWATSMIGNPCVSVPGSTMKISVCLPRNHSQRFPDTFVDFFCFFMNKTVWANQQCTPCRCSFVFVQESGFICTVWKVFRLRGKNSEMQIPSESHRCILMFHWIWASKVLQCHWVF